MSLFRWLFRRSEKPTERPSLSAPEALWAVSAPPSVRGADLMLYMELAGRCDKYADQEPPVEVDLYDDFEVP